MENNNWLEEYIKYVNSIPSFKIGEEKELFERYFNGDMEAKEILYNKRLKTVLKRVMQLDKCNIPIEDLIQEGNAILAQSLNNFNPEIKMYFSVYLHRSLSYNLASYINANEDIPISLSMYRKYDEYNNKEKSLDTKSDKVLKKEFKISDSEYKAYKIKRNGYSRLESFKEDELTTSINDDTEYEKIEDRIFIEQLIDYLEELDVDDRRLMILKLRTGYGYDRKYTEEEIGKTFNISTQRIHQLETNLLRNIKELIEQDTFEFKDDNSYAIAKEEQIYKEEQKRLKIIDIEAKRAKNFEKKKSMFNIKDINVILSFIDPKYSNIIKKIYCSDKNTTINDLYYEEVEYFLSVVHPMMKKYLPSETTLKERRYIDKLANRSRPIIKHSEKEVLRVKRELQDINYPLTLDFTKEEIDYISKHISSTYEGFISKIYDCNLDAPSISWMTKEMKKVFVYEVYPLMKEIIKESDIRRPNGFCKFEENENLDYQSIISSGLIYDNPCNRKFTIGEVAFILDSEKTNIWDSLNSALEVKKVERSLSKKI